MISFNMLLRRTMQRISLTYRLVYLKTEATFFFPSCLYLCLLSGHLAEILRECPGCLQAAQMVVLVFGVDGISESAFKLKGVLEYVEGQSMLKGQKKEKNDVRAGAEMD